MVPFLKLLDEDESMLFVLGVVTGLPLKNISASDGILHGLGPFLAAVSGPGIKVWPFPRGEFA